MRYEPLGEQRASVIGLGVWQFGSASWGWSDEFGLDAANAIVAKALELGVTLFDTAEIYAGGVSESVLGETLGEQREGVIVASKVSPSHALRGQVQAAARRSLARLGTGRIDLYQVHWPNPLVPLSWTMAGMRDLQREGLVRHVGVSNFSARRWRKAEAALGSPVAANQVVYNLLQRGAEREVLPHAAGHGRLVIAYSPLAQGLLTGRYAAGNAPRGARLANRLFLPANIERAQPVIAVLREVAAAHGATPAQVALAWVVSKPGVVAIPGAKSVRQIEENAAAADIALGGDELHALDEASGAFKPVPWPAGLAGWAWRVVFGR